MLISRSEKDRNKIEKRIKWMVTMSHCTHNRTETSFTSIWNSIAKPTPNESQKENMNNEKQMVFSKQNFNQALDAAKNTKTRCSNWQVFKYVFTAIRACLKFCLSESWCHEAAESLLQSSSEERNVIDSLWAFLLKWREEIHPKAFRLTLFKGYRQNEVEILPNWFIYRKEEILLVKAVANKKGFRR